MRTMNDMMKMLKFLDRERDRMVGMNHCEITFVNHVWKGSYEIIDDGTTPYTVNPSIKQTTFGTFRWEMEKKTIQEYLDELSGFLFDKSLTSNVVDASYNVESISRDLCYFSHITRIEFVLEPSWDG